MKILDFLNTCVFGACLGPLLLFSGLYFWIRLRAFFLSHPHRALALMRKERNENGNSFRALAVALAGTLGAGNIAGVAVALVSGGAGSIFWMWVGAFASMMLKYAEIALTIDARRGENRGAVDYIRPALGRWPALVFSLLAFACSLFMGSLMQGNVIAEAMESTFSIRRSLTGVILLVVTLLLFLGGRRFLEGAAGFLIPILTAIYILLALFFIFVNITSLPSVFSRILCDAFSLRSAGGGIAGTVAARAVRAGISKGLFSNEAGAGTAPMAHGGAATRIPARQGLFGVLEVFIDTIVVCSMTAFVILLSFEEIPAGTEGTALVSAAFSSLYGRAAGAIVALSIAAFAYATVACWSYYGRLAVAALTGSCLARFFYPFLFSFLLFIGACVPADWAWGMTDAVLAAMTFLNVFALLKERRRILLLTEEAGLLPRSLRRRKKKSAPGTGGAGGTKEPGYTQRKIPKEGGRERAAGRY